MAGSAARGAPRGSPTRRHREVSPMRASRIVLVTFLVGLLAATARAGGVEDANKLAKDGRWAQAADAYRAVLQTAPGQRDALLGFARAVAEGRLSDRYEEATSLLGTALKAKPDDRDLRVALGYVFLSRTSEDERYRADVQDQFSRVLRADPADEDAAVGLARMYYVGADYARGLETLEGVLAKKPGSALALYWKGVLLYDEATQAFGQGPGMDDRVKGLFEQALASFEASTKADPSRFDAWMKLGYAAQYLTRVDPGRKQAAAAAYSKALDLDGENAAPLKGLSALYANEGDVWFKELSRLAAERPKTPIVLYYLAFALKSQGKVDDAEKTYRQYVAVSRHPAAGWFEIGEILRESKGDADGARKAYEASLRADPTHPRYEAAVYWLLQPLNERGRDAVADAGKARKLLEEYDAVIALAPKSITARNDAGFFLREAFDRTGKKDRGLLDASVARYEAASALIPEFRPEYAQSIPYRDRNGFAQVLNDTGLMFQYYPEVKDLKKAEAYYRRAMEWTDHGYWDAYGNMMKLYEEENRTEEAMDFALACAEGIKQETGEPQEAFRSKARADAEALAKKLGK